MLLDSDLDLIIIASPSNSHFNMAIDALKSGKHVVLEKPIASTINEVNELKRVSHENDRNIIPFYNFRFVDEFLEIKSILKEGLIGAPFLIKRQVSYFNRRNDWQSCLVNNGGIINAAATHHIDQILQLMGEDPIDIWGELRKIVTKGDAPDHCKLLMKFPSKCIVDIEISWAEAFSGEPWVIYGEYGAIWQNDNILQCKWFNENDVTKNEFRERSYLSNENINWKYKSFTLKEDYQLPISPIFYSLLATSLSSKGEIPAPVSIDCAINLMRNLENIERSISII